MLKQRKYKGVSGDAVLITCSYRRCMYKIHLIYRTKRLAPANVVYYEQHFSCTNTLESSLTLVCAYAEDILVSKHRI